MMMKTKEKILYEAPQSRVSVLRSEQNYLNTSFTGTTIAPAQEDEWGDF